MKIQWEFCGTVSVAGIEQAWREANEEEQQSHLYNPATFVQTLTVVYSYLRLPWAWRRKSRTEYLSFLAKMVLDNVARHALNPEQVEVVATAVLYLNRITHGKHGELKRLWQNWERLQLTQNLVNQALASPLLRSGTPTEVALHVARIRFIEDKEKRQEALYTLEKVLERSLPLINSSCQLVQIYREYALLSTEFAGFHAEAQVFLAKARHLAAPYPDAYVRTLLAWPPVFLGRRY
ncbi:MAG: hypothetical protein HQL88_00880 [Magnetococcales bacterium]|nr:hypothetical protein [Magnetococcales bacterium]